MNTAEAYREKLGTEFFDVNLTSHYHFSKQENKFYQKETDNCATSIVPDAGEAGEDPTPSDNTKIVVLRNCHQIVKKIYSIKHINNGKIRIRECDINDLTNFPMYFGYENFNMAGPKPKIRFEFRQNKGTKE